MYDILLVEDHVMIQDAIKAYFDENSTYQLKDVANNGQEALELLRQNEYEVVITDIGMPVMDGMQLMAEIRKEIPDQKTLVLTMFDESLHVKKMIKEGINGYVLKNVTKTELFTALDTIVGGRDYFSKEIYDLLVRNISKRKSKERLTKTTPISNREKEVLILIANEYSNKEIADKLFLSVRTVETHKRNLLEKTGCKNIAGLVMYAVEQELI